LRKNNRNSSVFVFPNPILAYFNLQKASSARKVAWIDQTWIDRTRLFPFLAQIGPLEQKNQVNVITRAVDEATRVANAITKEVNALTEEENTITREVDATTREVNVLTREVNVLTRAENTTTEAVNPITRAVDAMTRAKKTTSIHILTYH
jgi:hypothetical protein